MSGAEHTCYWCADQRRALNEARAKLLELHRTIESRPGTAVAKGCAAQIPDIKARIEQVRHGLAQHATEAAS